METKILEKYIKRISTYNEGVKLIDMWIDLRLLSTTEKQLILELENINSNQILIADHIKVRINQIKSKGEYYVR